MTEAWKFYAKAALLLLVVWFVFAQGVKVGFNEATSDWQKKWDEREAAYDAASQKARDVAAAKEAANKKIVQEIQLDAEKKMAEQARMLDAARTNSGSLQQRLADLRDRYNRLAGDPSASQGSKATSEAGMVLSELYRSCVAERQELAGAFEQSRARGLTCELTYDKVSSSVPP